ncbi:MAG TPA: hypothetical protein VHK89_02095 [Actinomycetota bacterium]|nr:hypothetical protein [Actinomycetota bacterium]
MHRLRIREGSPAARRKSLVRGFSLLYDRAVAATLVLFYLATCSLLYLLRATTRRG